MKDLNKTIAAQVSGGIYEPNKPVPQYGMDCVMENLLKGNFEQAQKDFLEYLRSLNSYHPMDSVSYYPMGSVSQ